MGHDLRCHALRRHTPLSKSVENRLEDLTDPDASGDVSPVEEEDYGSGFALPRTSAPYSPEQECAAIADVMADRNQA